MSSPIQTPKQHPARSRAPRRGFALIVVMTLLALVVLMILSLVTMVQLALQASKASVRQAQAQQNALLGVKVAMGQLIKVAGVDQRATGTADLARINTSTSPIESSDATTAMPAPGITSRTSSSVDPAQASGLTVLPASQGGTRFWTGVWGNAAKPSDMYGYDSTKQPNTAITTTRPVLLTWLVSGNEDVINPTYTSGLNSTTFNGQLTYARIPQTFSPNLTVGNLTANVTANSNVTINNLPAVVLVGPNTAGNITTVSTAATATAGGGVGGSAGGNVSIPATARYVVAPLVNISQQTTLAGRYAWWVGDEGIKAKYNVRDPYLTQNSVTTQPEARYRFAAQRFGIEVIGGATGGGSSNTDFSSYANISSNVSLSKLLDRIFTPEQTHSIDDSQSFTPSNMTVANDPMRLRFHDVTTYSYGVLSDSLRGGLRYDLTTALEQTAVYNDPNNGLTATVSGSSVPVGRNILPDNSNIQQKTHPDYGFPLVIPRMSFGNASLLHGPTWDQIRSFYQLTLAPTTQAIPVQPLRNPTIPALAFKYQVGISPVIVDARLLFSASVDANRQLFVHTQAAFVLGNPYSFPIAATSGLDLSYMIDQAHKQEWGLTVMSRVAQQGDWRVNFTRQNGDPAPQWPYFPILKNSKNFADTQMSVLDNVTFRIPGNLATFAPGQVKVFSIPQQNSAPLAGVPIDQQVFSNVYTKTTNTSSQAGGQHIINMVAGVNPDSFFTTQSGQFMQAGDSRWGYLLRHLPVKGITLQMRVGAQAPGIQVLQSVINADGTGGLENSERPNYFLQWYGDQEMPIFANGYVMSLALPATSTTVPNSSTGNFTAKYRVYADYNLRATNMALSPMANFNDARHLEGQQAIDNKTVPTLAPYKRYFIRTTDSVNADEVNTYFSLFNENMLSPRWGRANEPALGQNTVTLYTLPQRAVTSTPDSPLLSLAQLQHLDLTADDFYVSVGYQPGYAFANSWFTPYVKRDLTRQERNKPSTRVDLNNAGVTVSNVTTYDISYLLNTALGDAFYFSSIPQGGTINATAIPEPANQRLRFATGIVPTNKDLGVGVSNTSLTVPDPRTGKDMPKAYAPASYQMIDGAFNVNSTSVEAWKALLTGLRNLKITNSSTEAATNTTPFPRYLPSAVFAANSSIYGNYTTFNINNTSLGGYAQSYMGFRRLSDAEIARLAVQIVKEVRARGPFLSLAHFFNRRLGPVTDPTTRSGALQSAIDISALNNITGAPEVVDRDFPEIYSDPNRQADQGNRSTGIPGWLTQADLLQAMGPTISVRSDTFVIRAYGEALDPLDGSISGRAWCEAVVQRLPEYYDTTDTPDTRLSSLNLVNKTFGRKFRLVNVQWLNPTDI